MEASPDEPPSKRSKHEEATVTTLAPYGGAAANGGTAAAGGIISNVEAPSDNILDEEAAHRAHQIIQQVARQAAAQAQQVAAQLAAPSEHNMLMEVLCVPKEYGKEFWQVQDGCVNWDGMPLRVEYDDGTTLYFDDDGNVREVPAATVPHDDTQTGSDDDDVVMDECAVGGSDAGAVTRALPFRPSRSDRGEGAYVFSISLGTRREHYECAGGKERLFRTKFDDGQVHHYEGDMNKERLVRVEFACGQVNHYNGDADEERLIRIEYPSGHTEYYEGDADKERLVRDKYPCGQIQHYEGDPPRLVRTLMTDGRQGFCSGQAGEERLVYELWDNGVKSFYEGKPPVLVREELPDGQVDFYAGERHKERLVRAVLPGGWQCTYVGDPAQLQEAHNEAQGITIRRATMDDLDQMCEIDAETFVGVTYDAGVTYDEDMMRKLVPFTFCAVHDADSQVLGFITAHMLIPSVLKNIGKLFEYPVRVPRRGALRKDVLSIVNLAVTDAWRRHGIGKGLVHVVLRNMKHRFVVYDTPYEGKHVIAACCDSAQYAKLPDQSQKTRYYANGSLIYAHAFERLSAWPAA